MTHACGHRGYKHTYVLSYGVMAELCAVCAIEIGRRLGFAPFREQVQRYIASIVRDAKDAPSGMAFRNFDAFESWLDHQDRCPTCADAVRGATDLSDVLDASCYVGLQLYAVAAKQEAA
jgi:hypothetical protein